MRVTDDLDEHNEAASDEDQAVIGLKSEQIVEKIAQSRRFIEEDKDLSELCTRAYEKFQQYLQTLHPAVRDELAIDLTAMWMRMGTNIALKLIPQNQKSEGLALTYGGAAAWSLVYKELSLQSIDEDKPQQNDAETDIDAAASLSSILFTHELDLKPEEVSTLQEFTSIAIEDMKQQLDGFALKQHGKANPASKSKQVPLAEKGSPSQVVDDNDTDVEVAPQRKKFLFQKEDRTLTDIQSLEHFVGAAHLSLSRRLKDYARSERWYEKLLPKPKDKSKKSKNAASAQDQSKTPESQCEDGQQNTRSPDEIMTLDADKKIPRDIHNTDAIRELAGVQAPEAGGLELALISAEEKALLYKAIETELPPKQQKVILAMLRSPGVPRGEVAEMLGISEELYKHRLDSARKNLDIRMKKSFPNW